MKCVLHHLLSLLPAYIEFVEGTIRAIHAGLPPQAQTVSRKGCHRQGTPMIDNSVCDICAVENHHQVLLSGSAPKRLAGFNCSRLVFLLCRCRSESVNLRWRTFVDAINARAGYFPVLPCCAVGSISGVGFSLIMNLADDLRSLCRSQRNFPLFPLADFIVKWAKVDCVVCVWSRHMGAYIELRMIPVYTHDLFTRKCACSDPS